MTRVRGGFTKENLRWGMMVAWHPSDGGVYQVAYRDKSDYNALVALWQLDTSLDVAQWVPVPSVPTKGSEGNDYAGGAWAYWRFNGEDQGGKVYG